jgi:hypothetical protein
MLFMIVMTVWALVLLIGHYRFSTIGLIAMALTVLAVILIVEAANAVRKMLSS